MRVPVLMLAVIAAVLIAPAAIAADAFESYSSPAPVVVGGKTYLFSRVAGLGSKTIDGLTLCLREEGSGRWGRQQILLDYTALAAAGDHAYLFTPGKLIEMRLPECQKVQEVSLADSGLGWPVQTAQVLPSGFVAFGIENGRLVKAKTKPVKPGELPALWTVEAVVVPQEVAAAGSVVSVKSVLIDQDIWIFWTTCPAGGKGQTLWAAELRDQLRPERISSSDYPLAFAPASLEGQPVVAYFSAPTMLGSGDIVWRRLAQGQWSAFQAVPFENELPWQSVLDAAAISDGSRLRLFLVTDFRIIEKRYVGGSWLSVAPVQSPTGLEWLFEHWRVSYWLAIGALVLLICSLIRSYFLPRRANINGIEYALAPWWRRGAAYLVDLIIVYGAVAVAQIASGVAPTVATWFVPVFVFDFFYLTITEVRSGRSLGKRFLGLIVVSRNGGYPLWGESAVRNLPRVMTDCMMAFPFMWVGSLFILNTKGSQRMGDLLSGTYVVREQAK